MEALGQIEFCLLSEACSHLCQKQMNSAAETGRLKLLIQLHENGDRDCTIWAMDHAARNGHLEVVKWLHENRSEGCSTYAMNYAALKGHLEVVKWLHENRTEGCTTMAMNWAASNGWLKVVQWLQENRKEGCTVLALRTSRAKIAWFLASRYKHLKVARDTNRIVNSLYSSIETIEKAWGVCKLRRSIRAASIKFRLKCHIEYIPGVGIKYFEAMKDFYSGVENCV